MFVGIDSANDYENIVPKEYLARYAQKQPDHLRGGRRDRPVAGYITHASGDVCTPHGMVHVSWSLEENGRISMEYQAPANVDVEI